MIEWFEKIEVTCQRTISDNFGSIWFFELNHLDLSCSHSLGYKFHL